MIRQATAQDAASVRDCAERAFARYVGDIGRRPAPMDADFRAGIAAGRIHVALDAEGRFQGFVAFAPRGDHIHLESVAVLPSAAGKGVGKALIAFCENEARRLGFRSVQLFTNEKMADNLAMYPRLGYVEVARRTEDGFRRVFFEKPLP